MSILREHFLKKIDIIRGKRSKHWPKVRKKHIKKNSSCASCGSKKSPEVHHIKDFSNYPDLELDPKNLITLCGKRCHFLLGHLKNWKSINPNIEKDAKWLLNKIKNRRGKNKIIKAEVLKEIENE